MVEKKRGKRKRSAVLFRAANDEDRPDEAIVAAVQKGDIEQFRFLVERYEAKMARYARRFIFDRDEINDVLQEVFIKAFVNIQSFDITRRFSPWIYRIAHNEIVNVIKKTAREPTISLFSFDVLLPHPIAKETADSMAERREIKTLLRDSLLKIDAKYREPLVLYYLEDMDYREIAEILHVPISTVGVRLQRGKAALRKIIGKK